MARNIRERLRAAIEEVPEGKLAEVLDFMEFIVKKERQTKERKIDLDPGKDPILSYIGGVSHGSLAKDIDGELYGVDG